MKAFLARLPILPFVLGLHAIAAATAPAQDMGGGEPAADERPNVAAPPLPPDRSSGPKPRSLLIGPWIPPDQPLLPEDDAAVPGKPQPDDAGTPDGIAVDRLEGLDPGAIGLWRDPDSPPFPPDMWQESRRSDIVAMLPALPSDSPHAPVRALALRLLLSPAVPPPATDSEAPRLLLERRLAGLVRAGALEDLVALANRIPQEARDPDIEAIRVDALLAFGDYRSACTSAREAMVQSEAARWLRIVAFCDALDGDRNGAGLRLALYGELSGQPDPILPVLVEALLGEAEGTPLTVDPDLFADMAEFDPLLFSFARLLRLVPPQSALATAPPILLAPLAALPGLSPGQRLPIAMRAVRLGLMSGTQLAALMDGFRFSDAERASVFSSLEKATLGTASEPDATLVTGPLLDALLYRLASDATENGERLRWIEIALEHGDASGDAPLIAALYDELLSAVPAAVSTAGFSLAAGRIHLMNGRPDEALAWLFAAEQAAEAGDERARVARDLLWPLMLLADASGLVADDADRLQDWWRHATEGLMAMPPVHAGRIVLLLELFGHEIPDGIREDLLAAPPRPALAPSAFSWRAMLLAGRERRLGEALLAGLAAAGPRPEQVDPALLQALLATMLSFGYEDDARRLAVALAASF